MKLIIIVTTLVYLLVERLCEASQCVCVYSRYYLQDCQDVNLLPVASLEQDSESNNCLLAVPQVVTNSNWKAGIYIDRHAGFQQVVYLQNDTFVKEETCDLQRLPGKVDYNHACTQLQPGTFINPLPTHPTPTTSTTQTPPTTSTQPPIIFTRTPTMGPTPTSATPTPPPIFITVATPKPSDKCDWKTMLNLAISKTPAIHSSSRSCTSGKNINAESEALLFNACTNPHNSDYRRWTSGVKIMDNCYGIPKGEPIGIFFNNGMFPIGAHAAFWKCTGSSFSVIYQSCGTGYPVIGEVSTVLNTRPEMLYTIQW